MSKIKTNIIIIITTAKDAAAVLKWESCPKDLFPAMFTLGTLLNDYITTCSSPGLPYHPTPPHSTRPPSAVTVDTGVVRDSETVAKAAKDDPGTGLPQHR